MEQEGQAATTPSKDDTLDWLQDLEAETSNLLELHASNTKASELTQQCYYLLGIWLETGELIRNQMSDESFAAVQRTPRSPRTPRTLSTKCLPLELDFDHRTVHEIESELIIHCQHVSALLCHSSAHTKQLFDCIKPVANATSQNLGQVKGLDAKREFDGMVRDASEWPTSSTSKSQQQLLHDLACELDNITREREEFKATLLSVQRLCTLDRRSGTVAHESLAAQALHSLSAELVKVRQEYQRIQEASEMQAITHLQALEHAKSESDARLGAWLRKLDSLSMWLVNKKRAFKVFQNWSARCHARHAGHELVYERKANCCMQMACIQCEHLPRVNGRVEGEDAATMPTFPTLISQPRTFKNPTGNREHVLCGNMTEHEMEYIQKTIKKLIHLIYLDGPAEVVNHAFQLQIGPSAALANKSDALDHSSIDHVSNAEPGVLGMMCDANGLVIEVVPYSPAYTSNLIRIGDRLVEIDGQAVASGSFYDMLYGPIGSTVELGLEEAAGKGEGVECAEFHASEGVRRTKRVRLTRESATAVMLQNWRLPEDIKVLARFVIWTIDKMSVDECSDAFSATTVKRFHAHSGESRDEEASPGLELPGTPSNEGMLALKQKEVRLTLHVKALEQQLALHGEECARQQRELDSAGLLVHEAQGRNAVLEVQLEELRWQTYELQREIIELKKRVGPEEVKAGHTLHPHAEVQEKCSSENSQKSQSGDGDGGRCAEGNQPTGNECRQGPNEKDVCRRVSFGQTSSLDAANRKVGRGGVELSRLDHGKESRGEAEDALEVGSERRTGVGMWHLFQCLVLGLVWGMVGMGLYYHHILFGSGLSTVMFMSAQNTLVDLHALLLALKRHLVPLVTDLYHSAQQFTIPSL